MNAHLNILEDITSLLTTGGVAIPIIFGTIAAISAIIKGATGSGPSLTELADLIDKQLEANDAAGKAEIARLKALLGD